MSDLARATIYDCVYILRDDLSDAECSEAMLAFANVVTSHGGHVIGEPDEVKSGMGRRQLAYPIAHQTRGYYVNLVFAGGGPVVNELSRVLRLDSRVLRHIIVGETRRQYKTRLRKQAAEAAVPAPEPEDESSAGEEPDIGAPAMVEQAEAEYPEGDAFETYDALDEVEEAADDYMADGEDDIEPEEEP